MATGGLDIECQVQSLAVDRLVSAALQASTAKLASPGIGQITGLALDHHSSKLYAFHRSGNTFFSTARIAEASILAFSLDGKLRGTFARNVFLVPHGLSIDHRRRLWATDVALHQVMRIDPSRDIVELTIGAGVAGHSPSHFNKPTDVAVHPVTEEVFVADGYGNSRVAVYSYTGEYLREFGSAGSADGQFRVPHSLVIDKRGYLYVADRENSRVQVRNPSCLLSRCSRL